MPVKFSLGSSFVCNRSHNTQRESSSPDDGGDATGQTEGMGMEFKLKDENETGREDSIAYKTHSHIACDSYESPMKKGHV